jgi:hypothetical protein
MLETMESPLARKPYREIAYVRGGRRDSHALSSVRVPELRGAGNS